VLRRRLWWLCLLGPVFIAGTLWAVPEEAAKELPPAPVSDRMCAGCHSGVTIEGSSHAILLRTTPGGACEACHGPAEKHAADPWQHPLNKNATPTDRAALCLTCHRSGPDHVTDWVTDWVTDRVKSEFALAGKTCADCHTVHGKSDAHLGFKADEKGFLGDDSCRACHAIAFKSLGKSRHAGVIGQPGGGCEACHGAGGDHVKAVRAAGKDTAIIWAPARKNCLLCHRSAPETHKKMGPGFEGQNLACGTCHGVHVDRADLAWLTADKVERKVVGNEACEKCHAGLSGRTASSVHAKVSEHDGCEKCHGPGSAHVASGGRARFILNPLRGTPEDASAACLACHSGAPDHAKDWKGGALEKNGLSCLTCHQAHGAKEGQGRPVAAGGAVPAGEARNVGTKVCAVCHVNAHPDLKKSPHRSLMENEDAAGCESCHGPGSLHAASGGKKGTIQAMTGAAQAALCYRCHGVETKMIRWSRSEHSKAGLTCTSCHDPLKPAGQSSKKRDPDSCYVCHQAVRAQFRMPNSHPINRKAMNCSSCHDPHADVSGFLALEIREEKCEECHKQYRGPFLYEHQADVQDGCLACHVPHGGSNRRLLTHRNVSDLCIQCHVTPSSHDLGRGSSFRNCLNCHGSIHGSYVDKNFFR